MNKLKIFNRVVGECSGWDETDYLSNQYYDFVPTDGFDMPKGTLLVNYTYGFFETYDDNGAVIVKKDFMKIMNGLIARQEVYSSKPK